MTEENGTDPGESIPFYQAHKTKLASAWCDWYISKMNDRHEMAKRLVSQIHLTGFGFIFYYSLSILSKYSLMLFPFRRKCKSIKITFTSSAATSSVVIQPGCLLLFVRNSSAWALHREENNSVFLIHFRFKLLKCRMEKWIR